MKPFLVKWKGFDKPEETSAASLKGFPELTKAFRAKSRKRASDGQEGMYLNDTVIL